MRQDRGPGYWIDVIDDDKGEFVESIWVPQPETPMVELQGSLEDMPQTRPSIPPDPFTPIGLIAQCRTCYRNRDLRSFYEPDQVFTACRECRSNGHDHYTPNQSVKLMTVAKVKYECPCGSIVLNRERHERATKKHKAWKRGK
jgi:hypothetical protein